MEEQITLKDCKLFQDKEDGNYYLSLKYEIDRLDGVYQRIIPKVSLSLFKDACSIDTRYVSSFDHRRMIASVPCTEYRLRLGCGVSIPIESVDGNYYSETLIKKKTRKMTLAEIEKELGYSVEVVSKK